MKKNVWDQIKNITKDELIRALKRDGWIRDQEEKTHRGAILVYIKKNNDNKRVTIHYHPKETFRDPKLLKNILNIIGWTEEDLRRLKLIK